MPAIANQGVTVYLKSISASESRVRVSGRHGVRPRPCRSDGPQAMPRPAGHGHTSSAVSSAGGMDSESGRPEQAASEHATAGRRRSRSFLSRAPGHPHTIKALSAADGLFPGPGPARVPFHNRPSCLRCSSL
jgi:hypothetical protein